MKGIYIYIYLVKKNRRTLEQVGVDHFFSSGRFWTGSDGVLGSEKRERRLFGCVIAYFLFCHFAIVNCCIPIVLNNGCPLSC